MSQYGDHTVIPEPEAFQTTLHLDGCPAPDPEDTEVHLEMSYEIAREVIEQARSAERVKERLGEVDLERYRVRLFCWGRGTRE